MKLFHNKDLQKRYLPDLLTALFSDKELRLIVFLMQRLYKGNKDLTVDNMLFIMNDLTTRNFLQKNAISPLTGDQISNVVFDMSVSSNSELFHEAYMNLHDVGFAKFVETSVKDINYELGYNNRSAVIARVKTIEKAHNIIFGSKLKRRTDDIGAAAESLLGTQYQPFFSKKLTAILGGLSKGFPCTIIGRPSHAKSTIVSYDACYNIKHKILDRVDIVSPEEPAKIFWYRVFSHEFKINMERMLHGLVVLTREQVQKIRDIYEGKLFFHPVTSFQETADLIASLKTQRIIIDHVNALPYPRGDQYTGIISLVNFEKDYLAKNKETVLINLSQVNTKEMLKKGRLIPMAEDAYQSTVLQQASREFLSIYYPYKDMVDPNHQKLMVGKPSAKSPKDAVQVYIEKNSFGKIGFINLKFHQDFSYFEDYPTPQEGEIASNIILGDGKGDLFGNV